MIWFLFFVGMLIGIFIGKDDFKEKK